MKIRCAWCKPPRIIGEKEPFDDDSITDGMCHECFEREFSAYKKELPPEEPKDGNSIS